MPFSSQELIEAGKISLDFYLKNNPIDQVAVERPLFKMLNGGKRSFPGAKEKVVEQLRYRYQSNFQWFNGAATVTYNRRHVNEQASFAWRGAHDGFSLDEDRLIQNGISVDDSGPGGNASQAERMQLTNLFEEMMEVLRLGFQEQFSFDLHRDGTQSTDAIAGLSHLVSTTPTSGSPGGIDRSLAANAYWRNHAATDIDATTTTGNIIDRMETGWRACVRNGGRPTNIIMGSNYNDGYRNFLWKSYGKLEVSASSERTLEGGTRMLLFHGIDMVWSPEFLDLQNLTGDAQSWEKRCYMLNGQHIRLRPVAGQDMISRKPPRPYDRYEYYWALTWRGAVTMNRGNAHAVFYGGSL